MASDAPITGAPAGAPPPFPSVASKMNIVTRFEDVFAEFSNLGAVLDAAAEEMGPDTTISPRGVQLLYAAQFMFSALDDQFSKAVSDSMTAAHG